MADRTLLHDSPVASGRLIGKRVLITAGAYVGRLGYVDLQFTELVDVTIDELGRRFVEIRCVRVLSHPVEGSDA